MVPAVSIKPKGIIIIIIVIIIIVIIIHVFRRDQVPARYVQVPKGKFLQDRLSPNGLALACGLASQHSGGCRTSCGDILACKQVIATLAKQEKWVGWAFDGRKNLYTSEPFLALDQEHKFSVSAPLHLYCLEIDKQ